MEASPTTDRHNRGAQPNRACLAAFAGFAKGRPKLTSMMVVRSADPVFWNNLHNKDFWEEMPALVKDGAAFLQVRFWLFAT